MRKKEYVNFYDEDGVTTGGRQKSSNISDETFFSHLAYQEDCCPNCDYQGQFKHTSKGYKCPKCKDIIYSLE